MVSVTEIRKAKSYSLPMAFLAATSLFLATSIAPAQDANLYATSSGTKKQSAKNTKMPYQEPTEQTLKKLDDSQRNLKAYADYFSSNWQSLDTENFASVLEGLATETVLAETIRSIYSESLRQGWKMTDRFKIFPIHQSAMNSQTKSAQRFDSNGARVAVLGLRIGLKNRGIILTSHYRPTLPGELERQFRTNEVHTTLLGARQDFNLYARDLIERMTSGDRRVSEYLPIKGSGESWVLGCEKIINEKFCINARVFDSSDTRTQIFYDVLMGHQEEDLRLRAIKETKLAWPVKDSYISRGFKLECSRCDKNHYGLDLATQSGTHVYAIQSGVVLKLGALAGWGLTAVIEHTLKNGDKFVSLYAHLSQFRKGLRAGQSIERGEVIARSGNSGSSTGPHLHLEIRYSPGSQDPLNTLRQPRSQSERPLDPLRVLDVFNVFIDSEQ
jgi:murein DD-endopeptidase MepM/ murein hydrolase activator NlpD